MTETLFLQEFDSNAVGWIFPGKFDFLEDYNIQREFCLNHIGIKKNYKKFIIKVGNFKYPKKKLFYISKYYWKYYFLKEFIF